MTFEFLHITIRGESRPHTRGWRWVREVQVRRRCSYSSVGAVSYMWLTFFFFFLFFFRPEREISLLTEVKVQYLVENHKTYVKRHFSGLHSTRGGRPDQSSATPTTCTIRTPGCCARCQFSCFWLSAAPFGSFRVCVGWLRKLINNLMRSDKPV